MHTVCYTHYNQQCPQSQHLLRKEGRRDWLQTAERGRGMNDHLFTGPPSLIHTLHTHIEWHITILLCVTHIQNHNIQQRSIKWHVCDTHWLSDTHYILTHTIIHINYYTRGKSIHTALHYMVLYYTHKHCLSLSLSLSLEEVLRGQERVSANEVESH